MRVLLMGVNKHKTKLKINQLSPTYNNLTEEKGEEDQRSRRGRTTAQHTHNENKNKNGPRDVYNPSAGHPQPVSIVKTMLNFHSKLSLSLGYKYRVRPYAASRIAQAF